MTEHSMDETMSDVSRSARLAVMLMAQAGEQAARRMADAQRAAAHESRERANGLREELNRAQDAARSAYQPLTDPRRFSQADVETAAAAWGTAAAWAETDPQAAAAEASLRDQIVTRWGVDPEALREQAEAHPAPEPEADRLAEVMDPEWREQASTQELERRWQEANTHQGRPGAAEALAALDAELGRRFGLDVEKLRQSEQGLTETVWHAMGDRAATEADQRAEATEQRSAAGWENEAHAERNREATAGDDVGQEVEDSVDAREAEGKASSAHAAADVDHGQARADAAAMDKAGVPARSQRVRTSTAKGFGASTEAGARRGGHAKARKATSTKGADRTHDRGR